MQNLEHYFKRNIDKLEAGWMTKSDDYDYRRLIQLLSLFNKRSIRNITFLFKCNK